MSPSHQMRFSVRLLTQLCTVHTTGWGSLLGGRFGVTLCSPGNNSPSYKFSVENKARKRSKDRLQNHRPPNVTGLALWRIIQILSEDISSRSWMSLYLHDGLKTVLYLGLHCWEHSWLLYKVFCCGLVLVFFADLVVRKKDVSEAFLTLFCSAFYYFFLVLVDRIVDIKPVEIFCDLLGVHWISFPSAYFGRVVATAHGTNYCESVTVPPPWEIRDFKQQRRRWPRKRHLKSEFALLQTLSYLFHVVQFVKCW